jgi:hypothetical protein
MTWTEDEGRRTNHRLPPFVFRQTRIVIASPIPRAERAFRCTIPGAMGGYVVPKREKCMDWILLVLGLVLGSCVTSALIWAQRGTARQAAPPGYFARVAMSVVVTALLAGLVVVGIEYAGSGSLSATGIWLGSGWMLGGLLAGWFLSGAMQRG